MKMNNLVLNNLMALRSAGKKSLLLGILLGFTSGGWLWADVNYDTFADNSWLPLPATGEYPGYGGDVHGAADTSGSFYMIGGCTNGNGAGGSHNSDVYRFNLETGQTARLYNTANPQFKGSCQKGQAYDASRNCIWFCGGEGNGNEAGPGSNTTLWKLQCPDGPITNMNKDYAGAAVDYLRYDPKNDKLYAFNGQDLAVFDCKTSDWSTHGTSFNVMPSAIPCCADSKRGLFVFTMGTYNTPSTDVTDVWFYDGATGLWSKKTPPSHPGFFNAELAYDSHNDKYVYFGGPCVSEVWAYDYDSNTWAQMSNAGKAYNDNNPLQSTWAPGRHKHAWAYSDKYDIFVNWGGGQWFDDPACSDYDNYISVLWIYRLGSTATPISFKMIPEAGQGQMDVFPNPLRGQGTLSFANPERNARLSIYDVTGRMHSEYTNVRSENVNLLFPGWVNGTYLLKLESGSNQYFKKIIIQK